MRASIFLGNAIISMRILQRVSKVSKPRPTSVLGGGNSRYPYLHTHVSQHGPGSPLARIIVTENQAAKAEREKPKRILVSLGADGEPHHLLWQTEGDFLAWFTEPLAS